LGGGRPISLLGSTDDASDEVEGVTDFRRVSLLGSTDGGSEDAAGSTGGGTKDTEGNTDGGDNDDKQDTPVLGSVGGVELSSTSAGTLAVFGVIIIVGKHLVCTGIGFGAFSGP